MSDLIQPDDTSKTAHEVILDWFTPHAMDIDDVENYKRSVESRLEIVDDKHFDDKAKKQAISGLMGLHEVLVFDISMHETGHSPLGDDLPREYWKYHGETWRSCKCALAQWIRDHYEQAFDPEERENQMIWTEEVKAVSQMTLEELTHHVMKCKKASEILKVKYDAMYSVFQQKMLEASEDAKERTRKIEAEYKPKKVASESKTPRAAKASISDEDKAINAMMKIPGMTREKAERMVRGGK